MYMPGSAGRMPTNSVIRNPLGLTPLPQHWLHPLQGWIVWVKSSPRTSLRP